MNRPRTLLPFLLIASFGCDSSSSRDASTAPRPRTDSGPALDTGAPPADAGMEDACVAVGGLACGQDAGPSSTDAGPPDSGIDTTRSPSCPVGSPWVVVVSGRIVDEAGQAMGGAKAQLCIRTHGGTFTCIRPVDTDPDGAFAITVTPQHRCVEQATLRMARFGENLATTYCHAEMPVDEPLVTIADPYVLFETVGATNIPPLGDETVARTVVFYDGLEVDVIPRDAGDGSEYPVLGSRKIDPSSQGLCFLPSGTQLEALYALSPEFTVYGDGFPLRIPNATSLPANTQVDLFTLGGLGCTKADGTEIREAEWESFGTGTVNAAGDTIVSDAMSGLRCWTWLGVSRP